MTAAVHTQLPTTGIRRVLRCALTLSALTLVVGLFVAADRNAPHAPAAAVPAGYAPPSLDGYHFDREHDSDGNGDNIKETRVRHFRNTAGEQIFTLTTRGQIWAWSLDQPNDDDADTAINYVIRDSDCNGSFDERYRLDQEFHVPDCLQ